MFVMLSLAVGYRSFNISIVARPVEDGRDVDNSFSNPSAANKCQKWIDKMISIFLVQV